jgi:diazepam-binding inhibitor (GABA receptor modulator, acyl-CoA-binding protein)
MDIAELSMLLESTQASPVSPEEFEEAARKVKSMTGLDDEQRLQLYGLFKQAVAGDNTTPQPWSIEFVAKAKWDAWNSFKGFPSASAAMAYVYLVNHVILGKELVGGSPSGNASSDKDADSSSGNNGMGFAVSTLM